MKSRRIFPLFAVLAIVIAAGCVGQQGNRPVRVVSDDGLQVVDFFAEPVDVDVGDIVTFILHVENVGGTTAKNAIALLQDVEGQWDDIHGAAAGPTAQQVNNGNPLEPPNPKFNQPGDFEVVTWVYKAPGIPPGLEQDKKVRAEVIYTYNSSGTITMKAIGETFLETEYLAKGKTPEPPLVQNTYAPVQIKLSDNFINQYIRVKDDAAGPAVQTPTIIFELVNVGSGFPITDGSPGTLVGTIRVRGPGNPVWEECLGNSGTNTAVISPNTIGAAISAIKSGRGKSTFSCSIQLNKDNFILQDESIFIEFYLEYRYYIQSSPLVVKVSSFG